MAEKKKTTVPLSIYLVREQYKKTDEIIDVEKSKKEHEIPIPGCGKGKLYVTSSPPRPPKWTNLFEKAVDPVGIGKSSSVSAALLVKSSGKFFVLTFGPAGRFLIRDNVCEDRFGLKVALNSVSDESFRCVDKHSLDSIQSHSRIQSSQETTADQFGLDVEQDMLRAIVGSPKDVDIGSRMTGTDSLSVSVAMDLSDLKQLLDTYKTAFETDLSKNNYEWVNNISEVKPNSSIISELDSEIEKRFATEDYENLWLALPEIIDWEHVKGFKFSAGKNVRHPDINISRFLEAIGPEKVTVALLQLKKVHCVDEDNKKTFRSWSVYKCIYAEIDYDGKKYILNGGTWFRVDASFVTKTDKEFSSIIISSLKLPDYKDDGEGAYNVRVATGEPDKFALMDADVIHHGGGHGKVEVCDLLSKDRQLIHVKHYGKSSVLSHLFAQGFVSGSLIRLDKEFRAKVVKKLSGGFAELIDPDNGPKDGEFTIVFAIISESEKPGLHLPFFSRVNLNNTVKNLLGWGYKVELLKISVDPLFAKTKTGPKGKVKKLV